MDRTVVWSAHIDTEEIDVVTVEVDQRDVDLHKVDLMIDTVDCKWFVSLTLTEAVKVSAMLLESITAAMLLENNATQPKEDK